LSASLYNLSLSREISSSHLHTSEKGLRDRGSLVVKQSEHKGITVLVWFRTCKGFLPDSGTLKRVAWGLDVGTRVWLNQYKTEFCTFSSLKLLYLLLLYIYVQIVYFESSFRDSSLRELGTCIKIKVEF